MILVTVELISAIDGHREILGVAEIWNDGKGSKSKGNYGFKIGGRNRKNLTNSAVIRQGDIKGFPRNRLLAWDLLYRCLHQAFGERNR